jgi:hypothetical protein
MPAKTTGVKEHPLPLADVWVRAILAGRKTQTRRPIFRDASDGHCPYRGGGSSWHDCGSPLRCPYGQPGDRLWVRECYRAAGVGRLADQWVYRSDGRELGPWISSRYMPRVACRLVLEVLDVRAERLQGISEDDAMAEGVKPYGMASAGAVYLDAWQATYGDRPACSIVDNPWVWVVTFRPLAPAAPSQR